MSHEGQAPPAAAARPNFWLVAGLVIAALAAIYWLFLRADWVPVLVNLDPQDAAEVSKVLDGKKIEYRFAADGRTIEVTKNEADRARIELAGSELPMKGQIGFELFNQSDMGLTEFAQKINYQRALQGELARTILLLDGIQTARVHLGLPERSVFRGEQGHPKASVTLILRPGKALSSGTVAGIQRLVAGAIPDMPVDAVAVLDGTGRLISTDALPPSLPDGSSDAVVGTVRQRLTSAIALAYPDQRFNVLVSLRYLQPAPMQEGKPAPTGNDAIRPARGMPDYVYAIRLITQQPLDEVRRSDMQRLIFEKLDFDAARGDTLVFVVGPLLPAPEDQASAPVPDHIVAKSEVTKSASNSLSWPNWWVAVPLLIALVIGVGLWFNWHRVRARKYAELGNFTDLLRQRLETEGRA